MIYELMSLLFLVTTVTFVTLYLRLKTKYSKLLDKHNSRPDSLELSEFLFDIRSGSSLLQVKRIDGNSVMIRSPRG